MNNISKVCFVIIGTLIGAGFASGKEIYTFFNTYGILGFIGIFISNIIIALIIYYVFNIIKKENISSYEELTHKLIGHKRVLTQIINNIINIFLLISFFVMIAGFGAYFKQEYNIPIFYGAVIITFFSYIVFLKSIEGIVKINGYLIPVLLIFIVSLGIKCNINFGIVKPCYMAKTNSWFIKSILYASYNSIILIPILISLKKYIDTENTIKKIVITVFTISTILSVIIFLVLQMHLEEIKTLEIPIVYIASIFRKYI